MITSTVFGGRIRLKRMLKPWANASALPLLHVRLDELLVRRLLLGVGHRHHDDVGPLGRLGDAHHRQAGGLGLGGRLRSLAEADDDLHAGLLQVQRVGVALRAVADDRHLAAADDRRIGVRLVVHLGCHQPAFPFHGTQPCLAIELGQRHPAGALQLHDAIAGQQIFEVVELVGVAVERHGDGLDADGEDLALEDVDQLDDLAALLGASIAHGGEQQLALDGATRVELADLDDLDQLEQLLDDLLERRRLDVDDDRDAAEALVLGRRDGEREDVEAAPGEQAGHAGEHARPVLHEDARMWWLA